MPSAELKEIPRNPRRDEELQVRVGLGWGPPTLVDASRWGADRGLHLLGEPMRTLRLMERSYLNNAAHLGEGAGLVYEPRKRRVRVIGEGGVLFFETASGHRNRHELRGGRVSLLRRGDVWDLSHDRLIPAASARVTPSEPRSLSAALIKFAGDPTAEVSFESRYGRLLIRRRPDTQLLNSEESARPVRAEFDLKNTP